MKSKWTQYTSMQVFLFFFYLKKKSYNLLHLKLLSLLADFTNTT